MDEKKQVDLIFLDFCKAFDEVPHRWLLNKLKHYGITGNLVKWIEQWLTKRNQQVTLENHVSNKLPVKSGVPQKPYWDLSCFCCTLMTLMKIFPELFGYLLMIVLCIG